MKKITDDKYLATKIDTIIENAEQLGEKTGETIKMVLKGSVNVLKIITVGVALVAISFFGSMLFNKSRKK